MVFTFDCLYVPFKGLSEKEMLVNDSTSVKEPLFEIDIVSAFLLRHPLKHRLFHVVRMDGKELTLVVNKSDGSFETKFGYPVTRNIMISTSEHCKCAKAHDGRHIQREWPWLANEDENP